MEEQTEQWELESGTWVRDPISEEWRLASTRAGIAVAAGVSAPDVALLTGARSNPGGSGWFPPEFRFSPQTGAPLGACVPPSDAAWVPPFGESAASRAHPPRGLKRTSIALSLAAAEDRSASSRPDRTLPPLPLLRGAYRFASHRLDAASPSLLAVEPDTGELLVLLPQSQQWAPLQKVAGPAWGQRLRNPRGWRMEIVASDGQATLYCPCDGGLAVITPSVFGLHYTIECAGHGPALGGPVVWGGEIWTPIHAKDDTVHLVRKAQRAAGRAYGVLPTQAPVPPQGFESPVFDEHHVTWLAQEGQLVLRRGPDAGLHAEWVPWPQEVEPVFEIGCPYVRADGTLWQLCRKEGDGGLTYVQMASVSPPQAASLDGAGVCTGRVCYRGMSRTDEGPWGPMDDAVPAGVVLPLLESDADGAVIGLGMDARRGVLSVLQLAHEPKRASLQVEVRGAPAVCFGGIAVKRPWLALPFVHDGHLWLHHPDLLQVPGWKLEQ